VDGAIYQRLLAKLDESTGDGKTSAKRIFRRLQYAHSKLCIHIESEGHNSRELIVASRNISQGGISVLHSSFMYPGTKLAIDLIPIKGNIVRQRGTVTQCEHRGGRVHEVGIKFDQEISLRDFLITNPKSLLHSREKVDPEAMDIKLLVYSSSTDFSSQLREYLQPTSLRYTFAKTEEDALAKISEQDMVMCFLDNSKMQVPETIRKMREQGFNNPIILVGHPKSSVDMLLISACGADMILPWPCDETTLQCSIAEYVFNPWTTESLENIRMCISPEARQALGSELSKIGIVLDQQLRTSDQKAVHASCLRIRMMAPLLGLTAMKSAIESLTDRVAADGSLEELTPELTEISEICKAFNGVAA